MPDELLAPAAPAEPRPRRALLATKLLSPPPRPNLVPRPRLLALLDEGLDHGHRLTLVAAPAGFGKTTLVGAWLAGLPSSGEAGEGAGSRGGGGRPRLAWLSLDEADNDPATFLAYFVAALQRLSPNIGRMAQEGLLGPQVPPPESLIAMLINDIAAEDRPMVLVLDDYQVIVAPEVHRAVAFLLEHQPPQLHLVLLTRQEPPLPLPRLRARGQITQLGEQELRFTVEETAAFLRRTMGLDVSDDTVAALAQCTEGWAAGLQLAALSWQEKSDDSGAFVLGFRGDNRYVMDYLVAEVVQRQPEEMRSFLCATSILDRLTAPLCDAVTGETGSKEILEQLERANLFVVPLDQRREWYRYHRLFAEVLRGLLAPEDQAVLHRRAMDWYAAQEAVEPAIRHGLRYAAVSGDFGPAGALVRRAVEGTLLEGAVKTVRGWLEALPEELVQGDRDLLIFRGWAFCLDGELAAAEENARLAEESLRQAGAEALDSPAMGHLLTLRCFLAVMGSQDYARAVELAAQALQRLDPGQPHWRSIALWSMAESQESLGDIAGAIATLREARRVSLSAGNQISLTMVEMSLALVLNNHGKRRAAVAFCEEAISRYTDASGHLSPISSLILSRLGMLHYEANELQQAHECFERSLALGRRLGLANVDAFAQALAAPTRFARGEREAALDALQRAYRLTVQTGFSDPAWILTYEAALRFRQGDLPFVRRWAEAAGLTPEEPVTYLRLDQQLLYAQLLLAEGRLAEAQGLLARLEQYTAEHTMDRPRIAVLILQALAAELSGGRPAARELLAAALQLAAPEDYFRAFLDADERILALLPAVRRAAPPFVDRLLAYAGLPGRPAHLAAQPLVEPLSRRELEVLALIAAGLSNAAIAEKLVIAPGTVKRHVNHIYGKLEVQSRTQAVARARALGILG